MDRTCIRNFGCIWRKRRREINKIKMWCQVLTYASVYQSLPFDRTSGIDFIFSSWPLQIQIMPRIAAPSYSPPYTTPSTPYRIKEWRSYHSINWDRCEYEWDGSPWSRTDFRQISRKGHCFCRSISASSPFEMISLVCWESCERPQKWWLRVYRRLVQRESIVFCVQSWFFYLQKIKKHCVDSSFTTQVHSPNSSILTTLPYTIY